MSHAWAVVLGLVQGVTEFLPISSTAHLRLIPWVFGVDTSLPLVASAQFDIALHAGSLIAILAALWPDWVDLFFTAFGSRAVTVSEKGPTQDPLVSDRTQARQVHRLPTCDLRPRRDLRRPARSAAREVLDSCRVPRRAAPGGSVPGTLRRRAVGCRSLCVEAGSARLDDVVEGVRHRLCAGSRAHPRRVALRVHDDGRPRMGFSRETVARYSFMAALPIIGGAAAWGLRDVPMSTLLSVDWVLGFTAAALSSYLFMRVMLAYVRKHTFAVFMWYRIAAGLFFVALFWIRG